MTIQNTIPSPPSTDGDVKAKRSSKIASTKQCHKNLKRASSHRTTSDALLIDGRHRRVWKACERCRMKKTKCDGESPCKRCKDDGLVCTAWSRKKAEFKQLPRGYAEVLENTQYALIATLQKLYTMVRNNEPWTLGEPQVNDRGLPVIHNIAEKLGCIRPSPDLPYAFREGALEFAELQKQLKIEEDEGNHCSLMSNGGKPARPRKERASSSESDQSDVSHDFNVDVNSSAYPPSQQPAASAALPHSTSQVPDFRTQSLVSESQFGDESFYEGEFMSEASFSDSPLDINFSMKDSISPIYTDFPSTINFGGADMDGWATSPDELMTGGPGMDMASLQLRQSQAVQMQVALAAAQNGGIGIMNDGTIRPNLLDCRNRDSGGFDLAEQIGGFMFTEYAGRV